MLYLPTITGCPQLANKYAFALCSPSKKRPVVRGRSFTVIDCHTFYLRKVAHRVNPLEHYLWFCDFAMEHHNEPSFIFVAPDCDWAKGFEQVVARWPKDLLCLAVPGTALFPLLTNVIGHAWTPRSPRVTHPNWIHHFSKDFVEAENYHGIQTYDSIEPI